MSYVMPTIKYIRWMIEEIKPVPPSLTRKGTGRAFNVQKGEWVDIQRGSTFTSIGGARAYAREFGLIINRDAKLIEVESTKP